jgi:DNA-binding MarR family transcriptional regulator
MIYMALTPRRKEFLAKLKALYDFKGAAVHYGAVAEALGISKWTAYDMVQVLEREGYVRREYALEKVPGRSRLLVAPTGKAREAAAGNEESEEWQRWRARLLGALGQARAGQRNDSWHAEARESASPLIACAGIVTLLLMELEHFNRRAHELLREVVNLSPRPEISLSLVAGTTLGTLVERAADLAIIRRIADYIRSLQEKLAEISTADRRLLVDFVNEALI